MGKCKKCGRTRREAMDMRNPRCSIDCDDGEDHDFPSNIIPEHTQKVFISELEKAHDITSALFAIASKNDYEEVTDAIGNINCQIMEAFGVLKTEALKK